MSEVHARRLKNEASQESESVSAGGHTDGELAPDSADEVVETVVDTAAADELVPESVVEEAVDVVPDDTAEAVLAAAEEEMIGAVLEDAADDDVLAATAEELVFVSAKRVELDSVDDDALVDVVEATNVIGELVLAAADGEVGLNVEEVVLEAPVN